MTRQGAFRGWWIVAVAFVAQALAIGLSIIPYGLFIDPIIEEFGASVMVANIGVALMFVVMTLVGPLVGVWVDQRSARVVMTIGAGLMVAGFLGMSFARTLWQLAVLFGVGIAVGVAMLGPLPATAVVAKWFERQRGRALGIAAVGPMAGGFVLAPLIGILLESIGWRASLRWFALGVAAIVPALWWVIRNRPEDIGQMPDGDVAPPDRHPEAPVERAWTAREILSSSSFWALAVAVGIVFGLGSGWNANAPKYVGDLGHGTQQAGYLLAIGAGIGIPATMLAGWLADRYDNRALMWGAIALQTLALVLLWRVSDFAGLVTAFGVFGFSAGALLPIYASLIGRLFGSISFGQVMGMAGIVLLPFGAVSPPLAGWLRDSSGSYASTLLVWIGSFAIAGVILAGVRRHAEGVPSA